MNTIPIIFAIDNNVVMQCGITITSLLLNARAETFYDIYILCNRSQLSEANRNNLLLAFEESRECKISFVDVGEFFKESEGLATGHITTATYYRLASPRLFPQFDKVVYADIDMVFQQDLSELYQNVFPSDEWLAAVLDLAIGDMCCFKSSLPAKIGKSEKDYFNAGFLVMNVKRMREENVMEEFDKHARIKYDMNDQDVLNIVCNGHIQVLPSLYNFQPAHFANYMWRRDNPEIQFDDMFRRATLHYTGIHKPWNSLECVAADAWWHYYRMSPFYDDKNYFKRQYDQIEACRNDFRNKKNKQLFGRVLVNWKHRVLGK